MSPHALHPRRLRSTTARPFLKFPRRHLPPQMSVCRPAVSSSGSSLTQARHDRADWRHYSKAFTEAGVEPALDSGRSDLLPVRLAVAKCFVYHPALDVSPGPNTKARTHRFKSRP